MTNLVGVAALWVLGGYVGELWWPCAILTYLPQIQFGAPLVLLLPWSVWRRNRPAIVVNVLAGFVFLLGPMGFKARLPVQATTPPGLRVMTYNILGGEWDLAAVLQNIRRTRPDVFCLQEAALNTEVATRRLEREIRAGLPGYDGRRSESVMTLTRLPILDVRSQPLLQGQRSRPLLRLTVDYRGAPVTIANVHFVLSTPIADIRRLGVRRFVDTAIEIRKSQADGLLDAMSDEAVPHIVCGDVNTPPRGRVYGSLARRWRDAFGAVGTGFGYTFTSRRPVLRIDYIWLSGQIEPLRVWAPASEASDHRPVVADVVVR